MTEQNNLFNKEAEFLLQTYKRIPIKISHGEGVYLFSEDGKKYLDFFSGLAVNALGYGNKKIIQAIEEQIKKFIHLSNYYINSPQIELAEKLVKYSGLSKVFFTNSGTEAVEASLKLVRKAFGPEKKIITFSGAFHGRTYGALSLSGKEKYKKYFVPLLSNIIQLKFNDIDELNNTTDKNIAAIYIEFVQGEGGINLASDELAKTIGKLRDKFGFAIIADEVQSGVGRTGKAFAYQHYNIEPDLVIVAKAIGGGLPLGAMITNKKYSEIFSAGDHGSTFGGNPVACAAGLAVLNQVLDDGICDEVSELGDYFLLELKSLQKRFPQIILDVRGLGFMIGVEMVNHCSNLVTRFRVKGVLANCTNENVLRILPPLISTKENIDYFINIFNEILNEDK
jgi:acetylornithine/N-succinyldiaminopimelate aminotransferase